MEATWASLLESARPALLFLLYTFAATFAATLVGRLLSAAVEGLSNLKARSNATKYGALTEFDDYIFDGLTLAIVSVKTALVDHLKAAAADGKLTKEEAQAARDLAYETFLAALPVDIKADLFRIAGADVKAFVMARIPAVVEALKGNDLAGTGLDGLGAKVDATIKGTTEDPQ